MLYHLSTAVLTPTPPPHPASHTRTAARRPTATPATTPPRPASAAVPASESARHRPPASPRPPVRHARPHRFVGCGPWAAAQRPRVRLAAPPPPRGHADRARCDRAGLAVGHTYATHAT